MVGLHGKWTVGLARKPREAAAFYGVLAMPVMIPLMVMARRRDVMSKFIVAGPLYWLGWLSAAAMAVCVAAMIAGFFL